MPAKKSAPTKKKSTSVKKKPALRAKPAPKTQMAAASPSQLTQLRGMVNDLRQRIEKEAKARKLDLRLLGEARKARDEVVRQVNALRDQGKKLATQLRDAVSDSKKREQARQDALAMVAELRAELGRKTDELRRKTMELKDLAQQSAQRARQIIQSERLEPAPSKGTSGTPSTEEKPPEA